MVAFNGSYDFTVLDRELSRHQDTGVAVTGPVLDPHIIDRTLDRRRGKRMRRAAQTCDRNAVIGSRLAISGRG